MGQKWPFDSCGPCRRSNSREIISVRNQATAIERHPLTGVGRRILSEPSEFFAPLIDMAGILRVLLRDLRCRLIFHCNSNALVFRQGKGLKRAQYALLVDGLQVLNHDSFIILLGRVSQSKDLVPTS